MKWSLNSLQSWICLPNCWLLSAMDLTSNTEIDDTILLSCFSSSSSSLFVFTLPAVLPGATEATRKQSKSSRQRGGLCCAHMYGPAGSDYCGRRARRAGQHSRKCNCGGALGFNHVPVRLHLHCLLHQICRLILLVKVF